MMNLKQNFSILGFPNRFCDFALCIGVFFIFINSIFKFNKESEENSLFHKNADSFFFLICNFFLKLINNCFGSLFQRKKILLVFSTILLFPFSLNAQIEIPNGDSGLFVSEGTFLFGEDDFYVAEKQEVPQISKKEIIKSKTSKSEKKNVIAIAVEKKKVELKLPAVDFADAVYHADSKSATFLRSSFKSSSCAIVCTNFLYQFVGENVLVFNQLPNALKIRSENFKNEILDCNAFFLSELFSYQFFGTSPPFSLA